MTDFQQKKTRRANPPLTFPLDVKVKLISISDQLYIERSGSDEQMAYARKKLLKLKEEIEVFKDKSKECLLYTIKADRIIDFSAEYHFSSVEDGLIGRTKQHGLKSIWRTQFEVLDDTGTRFIIKHDNPWVELMEGLLMKIPIIGTLLYVLSGYLMNPVYIATNMADEEVAEMRLKPSFFESKFQLSRLSDSQPMSDSDQELVILSMFTMIFMQAGQDDGGGGFDIF